MNNDEYSLVKSGSSAQCSGITKTLLFELEQSGELSQRRISEIAAEINAEFTEVSEQYVKRESSTIPQKTAELILSSILYASDYALAVGGENAADMLKNMKFSDIATKGRAELLALLEKTKEMFKIAYKFRLKVRMDEYNYVIFHAFDEFLAKYSARFDAENICTSIDYPLLGKAAYAINSSGLLYINEYYRCIMHENIYCRLFPENELEALLRAYGRTYRSDYSDMLFNIAEVVFAANIAAIYEGKNPLSLTVSKEERKDFLQNLQFKSKEELKRALADTFSAAKEFLPPQTFAYIAAYIPDFSAALFSRLRDGGAEKLIICI